MDFPSDAFTDIGYNAHYVSQKAYNGVAMLVKREHAAALTITAQALAGEDTDEQARFIEAEIKGVRVINIYMPNGNPVPDEKYDYKLRWMERLYAHLKAYIDNDTPFIIGGDFNVIPEDKDCHSPQDWRGDALFRPETHAAWRKLLNLGLTDAFRVYDTRAAQYSFWDYQAGAWPRNNGIRIDHFLLCPRMADTLQTCVIHKEPRGWDKPSDHTPIALTIAL